MNVRREPLLHEGITDAQCVSPLIGLLFERLDMYTPTKFEIKDKADEFIDSWLADDEGLADALVMNLPKVRALLNSKRANRDDALLDLQEALRAYARKQRDFEDEAEDWLISNAGQTIQTDVDDFKFIAHEVAA